MGAAEPRGDVVSGDGELFQGGNGERAAAHAPEWTSRMRSTRCVISRPSMTTCDGPRYQMIRLVPVDMATRALSCRCSETKRIPGDKEEKEERQMEGIYL